MPKSMLHQWCLSQMLIKRLVKFYLDYTTTWLTMYNYNANEKSIHNHVIHSGWELIPLGGRNIILKPKSLAGETKN